MEFGALAQRKAAHVSPRSNSITSTGPLAATLRAATTDDLVRGLNLRNIATNGNFLNGLRDFFDLADALLAADSLQHCLTRLDRRSLAALVDLSEERMPADDIRAAHDPNDHDAAVLENLRDLLLLHDTPDGVTLWPEVASQLAAWPTLGLPDPREDTPEPGPDAAGLIKQASDALAAEHAFTATTAMAELLFDLERDPVKLLATGTLGRPGTRRLAELLRVNEAAIASYLSIAEQAGLVSRINGKLVASDNHHDWLECSPANRWATIADGWARAHWSDIRQRIAKHHFTDETGIHRWLEWNYPGGRDWLPQLTTSWLDETERLGITAHKTISTIGAHLLAGDATEAVSVLTAALPAPVERLYLQHDLTAVATGPLNTRIDARLRTMADVDGHTIASRYRFTNASITRAIINNETAATILDFLEGITLSGIPQPLEYLISETASRHGLLRIGPLPTGAPHALSYIRSNDDVLLRTVLIDRTLAALRLRPRDSEYLVSSVERNQLYGALRDAKYPVAMEDSEGHIIATRPMPTTNGAALKPVTAERIDPYLTLIARLQVADENAPEDSGEAWLARQLDSAIRTKSTVLVSVRMPNGKVVDYELEPASVSGGRLRARDPHSEIERTLPLASIVAVRAI